MIGKIEFQPYKVDRQFNVFVLLKKRNCLTWIVSKIN